MIPLDTIQGIRGVLLSDRTTFRGSEIPALNKMLNDLAMEEASIVRAQRTTPVPTIPPNAPAPETPPGPKEPATPANHVEVG